MLKSEKAKEIAKELVFISLKAEINKFLELQSPHWQDFRKV